ncbi:hypothetical protein [Pseudomonas aeruginosa]|nr:hypothetical protein [Pseudomonas aeruginosa]
MKELNNPFGENFKEIYKRARVGGDELLLNKSILTLPFFSGFTGNFKLDEIQLLNTGYKSFEYEGESMNLELDYSFFKYIMSVAQKKNCREVSIDFVEMLRDLDKTLNNYKHYRNALVSHLNKGLKSKFKYVSSEGLYVGDSFYSKISIEPDNPLFSVEISDTLLRVITSEFNHKTSYAGYDGVNGGAATRLVDALISLSYNNECEVRLETIFSLLGLQGKKDSKKRSLNRLIDHLKRVDFIIKCEDIKKKNSSRMDYKRFVINKKFSKNKLIDSVIHSEPVKSIGFSDSDNDFVDDNLDDVFSFTNKVVEKVVDPDNDISGFDKELTSEEVDSWMNN